MIQQERDGLDAARGGGKVKRARPARRRLGVGVAASFEQRRDNRRVGGFAGQVQRRVAADPRTGLKMGPGVDEHLRQLDKAVVRRPVQRRHAITLGHVHIRALPQ